MAKPYALPESLAELDGPTTGALDLLCFINWGPHYTYDLSDRSDLVLTYKRVIREAQTPEELRTYLHGSTLRRLWPHLFLPAEARAAWLARFPELGSTAAAA